MKRENGIAIKCPTCSEMIFVPFKNFDGNYGEIKGRCPKCSKIAKILIIVVDNESVEDLGEEAKLESKIYTLKQGDRIIYKPEDLEYEYGYRSQVTGKCVIYKIGERNMQDSFSVNFSDIEVVQ